MIYKKLIAILFIISIRGANGEQVDIGFWSGITIKHQVTRSIAFSFTEELRLNRNLTTVDSYFSDVGIEYEINSFKASANYRYINKNEIDYYSERHRFYADLSYKIKVKKISLIVRERIQQQYSDYNSSETGKIPEWYARTRFQVKFDLDKKYSPYASAEVYYVIDNVNEEDNLIDRYRIEAGLDYEFNRKHKLSVYVITQKDLIKGFIEINPGISYQYTI